MHDDWPRRAIGTFATESRLPGSAGDRARKITVKLYGRGAVPKSEATPGSASTRYYRRRRGQLIYSKLDFLNGAFAVVPHELDGFESTLDLPAFDLSDDVDADWFRRLVSQPSFYMSFGGDAKGSRKARRVNPEEFLSREVHVPPLAEQRKIAAILSSVDETIEKTEAVIAQLDVAKKAMLEELLTRGIPGRHSRFKQTEIGEVPEEWTIEPLADLVAEGTVVTYGIVQAGPHVDGGVPYVRTGDVQESGIVTEGIGRTTRAIADRYQRSQVRAGDLVICIRATIGRVAQVPVELDGANLTQGTARIAPRPGLSARFLLWAVRSPAVQGWLQGQAKGSTFREITLGRLRQAPVPIPSAGERAAIEAGLDSIERRIHTEAATLDALRGMKAALSSDLLTGRKRVPEAEGAA